GVTTSDLTDPDGPIYLARTYQSLGDFNTAQEWVDNALAREPNSGQAKLVRCTILYDLGQSKQALEEIQAALDDDKVFHRRFSRPNLASLGVFILLKDKQVARAKSFLFTYYPDLEAVKDAPPPTSIAEIGFPLAPLVAIERAAGEENLYKQLAMRMGLMTEELMQGVKPKLDYIDYLILARTGTGRKTDEQVIEYLENAIKSGYLGNWRFDMLMRPEFMHLHDHPRFKNLITEIEEKVARQRQYL
ncbi:MAG: tetratricopeptide repeat protein, partial [Gammaproteobacteria bacterium]|nr:tetratricopeptide repeat protein [Gammaproteobacteria bacterium]